jgi:preprotein translocase subunit SecD
MKKKLHWKIVLVLAVIALAIFLAYPLEKIHLGLDLKGGIHLNLKVVTDDAVKQESDQEILRLQDQFKRDEITYNAITRDPDRVGVILIQEFNPEKEGKIREILEQYYRDWDYAPQGTSIIMTLKAPAVTHIRNNAVRKAIETISNRVDELGLTEPTIQRQGSGETIIVELPGVENPERVKEIIKTTALLEWKLVKGGPAPTEEALLEEHGGKLPEDLMILKGNPARTQGGYYLVTRISPVTGDDLRTARRTYDNWNRAAVSFSFDADGSRRFSRLTGDNIGKPLAIVLDSKIETVANIETQIPDSGILRGNFTDEEAEDIALVLRAGALPSSIEYLEERTIGPSLGADSIRRGLSSIILALVLILVFMIFYYKLAGVNAVTAVILNIIILMGALAYFKASLTLPGIAGIILTIGMAVDANVLVFERIREELAQGKNVLSSIASGFARAFRTILDANVTTIIAAVFLFQFGTGPIKGFAVTLIIGITASMFTAIFVSRLIFDVTHNKKKKREKLSI